MAAYIRSVMNNSVPNTVIEFPKHNKSYRNWLDLPSLVSVCCSVWQ